MNKVNWGMVRCRCQERTGLDWTGRFSWCLEKKVPRYDDKSRRENDSVSKALVSKWCELARNPQRMHWSPVAVAVLVLELFCSGQVGGQVWISQAIVISPIHLSPIREFGNAQQKLRCGNNCFTAILFLQLSSAALSPSAPKDHPDHHHRCTAHTSIHTCFPQKPRRGALPTPLWTALAATRSRIGNGDIGSARERGGPAGAASWSDGG